MALTRLHSQLRQRLDVCEQNTGVDILFLDTGDEGDGELTRLCAAFWQEISRFFAPQAPAFASWIVQVGSSPETQAIVGRTRETATAGLRSWRHFRDVASEKLVKRFRQPNPAAQAGVRIVLDEAVERPGMLTTLDAWRSQTIIPNAYIEAQEGCGKSWVAASWVERLTANPDGPAVLWLESMSWSGCGDIEALITTALRQVLPPGDTRLSIFAGKILRV